MTDTANTTITMLNDLWKEGDVLIEATGTYPNGGGRFSECWARPVPEPMGGTPGTWEVLVFGETIPASLTRSDLITDFTLLYWGKSR